MRSRTLLGLVAVGLLAAGCGRAPKRPPVVLIILDTVRADHMSLYGYERDTTPRLAQLAAEGSVFEHAFTAGAWTLPAVGSILTGQWPSVHGGGVTGADRFNKIRADVPTLAELLRTASYATGAVVNGGYMGPTFGMDRGFEDYDFRPGTDHDVRRADVNVDVALDWIDAHADEPFFFLLHLFDAHRHYDAPEPVRGTFTDQFADRYPAGSLATLESRVLAEQNGDVEFVVAAYDEEILWLDREVGRFVDGLRERGLWGKALVLLTADHGEAFFEHDAKGHGSTLHNEVLRVPLMAWGPGVPVADWQEPVSTVDILPTVLDAVGASTPRPPSGLSLFGLFRTGELPERRLYAQNRFYNTDLAAVIDWPYKVIQDFKNGRTSLYDMVTDLDEGRDLADSPDQRIERVLRELRRDARELRRGHVGEAVELDEATREELRSLGYIQ